MPDDSRQPADSPQPVYMRGFGQVYRTFESKEDFQDDEVALLHGPDPSHIPLSEPLVHFRAALAAFA